MSTEKIIGIDFGTNNTTVSCMDENESPVAVKISPQTGYLIPTVLYFKTKDQYIIGASAAKNGMIHAQACVRNFKSDFDNPKKIYTVRAENGEEFRMNPLMAATKFLNKVIFEAQTRIAKQIPGHQNVHITKAIITVPAKFSMTAKGVVKRAVQNIKLQHKLMAEPTAAALAYLKEHDEMLNKTILVYDFGGGTFDLSILTNRNHICETLYTDGDAHLGGNDITKEIVNDLIDRINDDFTLGMPFNPEDYDSEECVLPMENYLKNYERIWEASENIKFDLSRGITEIIGAIPVTVVKNGEPFDTTFTYQYTAEEINERIMPEIQKTLELVSQALTWAEENNHKVNHIILAGGSSQIPLIHEKLEEMIQQQMQKLIELDLQQRPSAAELKKEYAIVRKPLAELEENPEEMAVYRQIQNAREVPSLHADSEITTLISRGAVWASLSVTQIAPEMTLSELGFISREGSAMRAFQVVIPSGKKLPCDGWSRPLEIQDMLESWSISIYDRDPKRNRRRKLDELTISNLPDVRNRQAKLYFSVNEEDILDVHVDIEAEGKIISKDHRVEKESNLLDD